MVVDGHHASLNPSDFFHPSVDAVALREGEVTACELVAALEEGRYIGDVPGLAINREGRQKITAPRETIKNLDTLHFGSTAEKVDRMLTCPVLIVPPEEL